MTKSEMLVNLASLPEGDARLENVAAALAGKPEPERPASMRLLKMGEAARETGLSRTTLWRAVRDNRLRAVEVRRGSRRISETELLRFVAGGA